jgi:mannose-1-phosphate guanylyltransferase/mannose-6-phosphate isomerase
LKVVPVILAGGTGSRLWPLSRAEFPKQFLQLYEKATLFQETLDRLIQIKQKEVPLDKVLIVANEEHRFIVLDQIKNFEHLDSLVLLEPYAKNTAPALTLASLQAIEDGSDPILVVSPADHIIQDHEKFIASLNEAILLAKDRSIILFGIRPESASTGFGYIEAEVSKDDSIGRKVLKFKEKPDLKTAENYYADEIHFWNSGIFVLRASVWIKAIKLFDSKIFDLVSKAFANKTIDNQFVRPNVEIFEKIPANSIDFAVIERCTQSDFPLKMIPLDVGWSDLGSWDALWHKKTKDIEGNVVKGDVFLENVKNSLIYSTHRLVSAVDIKNLIIVETSDAILVSDRESGQKVKEIVKSLELKGRAETKINRKVFRPWGAFDLIDEGLGFKVKRIEVNPGSSLSLQAHQNRAEHWIVVKGEATVICEKEIFKLLKNQSTYIPKGAAHRLSNLGNEVLEIIEVQTGNYLNEDDILRIDDDYGRE